MIKIQKRIKDLQTEYNELSSYVEDCLKSKFERITKVGTSQTLNAIDVTIGYQSYNLYNFLKKPAKQATCTTVFDNMTDEEVTKVIQDSKTDDITAQEILDYCHKNIFVFVEKKF